MMADVIEAEPCIHACSYGCGRKYDVIVVQVVDGSTLFLDLPCFASFAQNVVQAMVEANNPAVQEVIAGADFTDVAYVESVSAAQASVLTLVPPPEDEFTFDGAVEE